MAVSLLPVALTVVILAVIDAPLALALLLDSVTLVGPAPAAVAPSVVTQPEVRLVQDTFLDTTPGTRMMVARWTTPFKVAVTTAPWWLPMVLAVAVNVPLLEPVPMLILAGTFSEGVLLDKLTVAGFIAALFSVTAQVVLCPAPSCSDKQLTVDNCAGATRLSPNVLEVPLALATIVAV
jgi:hypothetical protein